MLVTHLVIQQAIDRRHVVAIDALPVEGAVTVDDVEDSGLPGLRSALHTQPYERSYRLASGTGRLPAGARTWRLKLRGSRRGMVDSAVPPASTSATIHCGSRLASSRSAAAMTTMYVTSRGSSWLVGGADPLVGATRAEGGIRRCEPSPVHTGGVTHLADQRSRCPYTRLPSM